MYVLLYIKCLHFLMSFSSLMSLTTGLKPFSPRSPGDLNLEDVVKFSRAGGKLSQGTVKFVGHLPGRSDAYLGVELDKEGEGCLSMWKKKLSQIKVSLWIVSQFKKCIHIYVVSCHTLVIFFVN